MTQKLPVYQHLIFFFSFGGNSDYEGDWPSTWMCNNIFSIFIYTHTQLPVTASRTLTYGWRRNSLSHWPSLSLCFVLPAGCLMVVYYYSISPAKKIKLYSAGVASASGLEQNMRTQVRKLCARLTFIRSSYPEIQVITPMEDAQTKTTHPSLNKATTTSQWGILCFPKRSSVWLNELVNAPKMSRAISGNRLHKWRH